MNAVFEYLKKHYKYDDPIFLCDIEIDGLNSNNLRQQIKNLTDAGYLLNYTTGIYCFKYEGEANINTRKVIESKYIYRNNHRFGYYSGLTFLNQLGISFQAPNTLEIVSNNVKAISKTITINSKSFLLRKPRVEINNTNAFVLPYLEALINIDDFDDNDIDTSNMLLKTYAKKFKITKNEVNNI